MQLPIISASNIILVSLSIHFALNTVSATPWVDNGGNNTNAGNVGIGIAPPLYKLHVEANGTSAAPGAYPTAGSVHFISWAGDGPATETGIPIFRFSAGRIATTDPNASRALLLEVATDDKRLFGIRGNGNVGIGTNNPTVPFDVQGRTQITGNTTNQEALVVVQAATSGAIFNARQGSNSKFLIDYSGNVGIGTTVTDIKLRVEADGSSSAPGAYPSQGSVHFTSWATDGPATETGIALFRLNAGRIATTDPNASKAIVFEVATDDKRLFGIRGNGNVGIGTNNPSVPLDVQGRTMITGNTAGQEALIVTQAASSGALMNVRQGSNSKFLIDFAGNVVIGSPTADAKLKVEADGSSGAPGGYPSQNTANFTSWAGDGPSSDNDIALFRFNAARIASTDPNAGKARIFEVALDDKRAFIVRGNGFVGIGNPNPTEKLDVDGNIKASGSLNVASVVTRSWTIQTPDYVFEKGYPLRSPKQVEDFVKVHKHLPDMPSAKELGAKGMDLAEMNLRLLKQVEELTLHMIRQQKEIDALKQPMKR